MVTITTTTATTEVEVKPFPKLMTHKYIGVVFFTEPRKGLWIEKGSWHEDLIMNHFEDYSKPLTIINK